VLGLGKLEVIIGMTGGSGFGSIRFDSDRRPVQSPPLLHVRRELGFVGMPLVRGEGEVPDIYISFPPGMHDIQCSHPAAR